MSTIHVPVLRDQVVELLATTREGVFVDATLGLGGHASAVLAAAPGLRLIGLDRDPRALELARERLSPWFDRVCLINRSFSDLPGVLDELGEERPVAILADLGCSSLQLDSPSRGFSFLNDGPLDMRMGAVGPTAADLVNHADEDELMRILWNYGEERRARALARAIVERRRRRPLMRTGDLVDVVLSVLGPRHRGRIHPATRTFQAIRIAVNDELGQLERFLEPAAERLAPGGRLAVISFHSLEDRIVKHTLRRLEGRCTCPPDLPVCRCGARRLVHPLTTKPIRPSESEMQANPRSRSARLRAVERVEEAT